MLYRAICFVAVVWSQTQCPWAVSIQRVPRPSMVTSSHRALDPDNWIPHFIKSETPSSGSQTFSLCLITKEKRKDHHRRNSGPTLSCRLECFMLIDRVFLDRHIPALTVPRSCVHFYVPSNRVEECRVLPYIPAWLCRITVSLQTLDINVSVFISSVFLCAIKTGGKIISLRE